MYTPTLRALPTPVLSASLLARRAAEYAQLERGRTASTWDRTDEQLNAIALSVPPAQRRQFHALARRKTKQIGRWHRTAYGVYELRSNRQLIARIVENAPREHQWSLARGGGGIASSLYAAQRAARKALAQPAGAHSNGGGEKEGENKLHVGS